MKAAQATIGRNLNNAAHQCTLCFLVANWSHTLKKWSALLDIKTATGSLLSEIYFTPQQEQVMYESIISSSESAFTTSMGTNPRTTLARSQFFRQCGFCHAYSV